MYSTLSFQPATELVTAPTAKQLLRRLNVRVTGAGKPTLLFCNGFNCDQRVWQAITPTLAAQYQLILFDQIGVGQSDRSDSRSPRYATMTGYVQDVIDICHALDLRQVALVGHSAGALVALLAAQQAPVSVGKVVLLATSPRYLNAPGYYGGFEPQDLQQLLHEMQTNYQAWASTFATMMIGQYDAPKLSLELVECASQADPEVAKHLVELFFMGDYRAEVPKLLQPTLLLQCADDPAVPEEVSRYLLDHLPDATLVVIPTAGHCPHLTAPAQVLTAIQQFLAPVEASANEPAAR